MISRKIDLTAHRDFSSGERFPQLFRIREFVNGLPDIDDPVMTRDEYDMLEWWEKIFGRKRHLNQKYKVFDSEERYRKMWRGICVRCGRRMIPWNSVNGVNGELCRQCDDALEHERIPWKKSEIPRERNISDTLFGLR